jgi:hypothetical protein
MAEHVQYLPLGLGTEHLIRPLVRDDLDIDRVKLLVPADAEDQLEMEAATTRELEETLGLPVTVGTVDTSEFAAVVAQGYDDVLAELVDGNEVYINVASPYWSLGAGYATAAQYLLAELTQADDAHMPDVSVPRERISLYYTEPTGYRVNDLVEAGQRIKAFRSDFEEVWKVAHELKSDVESDRQTVGSIASIFGAEDGGRSNPRKIIDALDAFGIKPDDDEGISRAIEDILTGIESVTNGIDILAQEHNRAKIESMPFLGPMANITEGLAEVSERADSDDGDGVTTAALLDYFVDRLDHVYDVLQRVEYLHDDFDSKFTHSPEEFGDLVADIEAHGIAQGARTYASADEQESDNDKEVHYAEVPSHLQFGLKPLQRAILYTLVKSGSANSVREFTIRVIQHALTTAKETGLTSPEGAAIDAIRTGDFDAGAGLLEETLLPTIQSKVQYHLTKLETDGFIHKKNIGQATGVELTRAGGVYAGTQDFTQEWRASAFEDLCAVITEASNDESEGGLSV